MNVYILIFSIIIFANFLSGMDASAHSKQLIKKLFRSIKDYKYEETEQLLQNYPALIDQKHRYHEIGCFSQKEMTSLHIAAHVGNCYATAVIISKRPSLIHSRTEDGKTPLHLSKNKRVAKLLLKKGAMVDAKDSRHTTPLAIFLFDEYKRNFEIASCLVKHGANINQFYNAYFKETLLHEAVRKNQTLRIAKFLLKHGANPELMDKEGRTPFNLAQFYGRKTELFEKVGIHYLTAYNPEEDPIALLTNGAAYFKQLICDNRSKRRHTAEHTLARLFLICKKQELENAHNDKPPLSQITTIQTNCFIKQYLLKYITFADIEKWIGEEGVNYARKYCDRICQNILIKIENALPIDLDISLHPIVFYYDKQIAFLLLKHMIKIKKNIFDDLIKVDITGIDEKGNSLLYYAIQYHNKDAISWLIENNINCTIQNKKNKTILDYLKEFKCDCKNRFFCIFFHKFLNNTLSKSNEKLIVTKDFGDIHYMIDNDRTLFFESLHKRPDKCLFFLKKGTYLNYKDKNGISPLQSLIKKCGKLSWEKIPNETKYLIRLLLDYNAIVERKTMQELPEGYLKDLLQVRFDKQKCHICFEHPEELSNIPCNNTHTELLCRKCYEKIKQCPLCCNDLDIFYT